MQKYAIAENIITGLGIPGQKKKEDIHSFKLRLIYSTDKVEDTVFDTLEELSRNWIESCITVISDAGTDEVVLPLFPEETSQEREADPTVADSSPGVRVRQRRIDALERKPKESSQWYMKILIAKNPNINHIKLMAELNKLGYSVTKATCYGVLSNFRQSIKVLQSLGMFTPYTEDK